MWRWHERFMQAGYDGLLRDKMRPWSSTTPKAVGISASSVQRIWARAWSPATPGPAVNSRRPKDKLRDVVGFIRSAVHASACSRSASGQLMGSMRVSVVPKQLLVAIVLISLNEMAFHLVDSFFCRCQRRERCRRRIAARNRAARGGKMADGAALDGKVVIVTGAGRGIGP